MRWERNIMRAGHARFDFLHECLRDITIAVEHNCRIANCMIMWTSLLPDILISLLILNKPTSLLPDISISLLLLNKPTGPQDNFSNTRRYLLHLVMKLVWKRLPIVLAEFTSKLLVYRVTVFVVMLASKLSSLNSLSFTFIAFTLINITDSPFGWQRTRACLIISRLVF